MKTQTTLLSITNLPIPLFNQELQSYWHKVPPGELVTKKRFLARLRGSMQFEHDQEFKRFYELAVEAQFKSVMRGDCRVIINY